MTTTTTTTTTLPYLVIFWNGPILECTGFLYMILNLWKSPKDFWQKFTLTKGAITCPGWLFVTPSLTILVHSWKTKFNIKRLWSICGKKTNHNPNLEVYPRFLGALKMWWGHLVWWWTLTVMVDVIMDSGGDFQLWLVWIFEAHWKAGLVHLVWDERKRRWILRSALRWD